MKKRIRRYNFRYLAGGGQAFVLAIWQLSQPAGKNVILGLLKQTKEGEKISPEDFDHLFSRLERFQLIWDVGDNFYIVTPQGAAIANSAIGHGLRDKKRLFFLNRKRNFEVGA